MIELMNVNKSFQDVKAVDNISLTIKDGLVMGLLGTNGAGKSTLLRMMSGVLKPDSGRILKQALFETYMKDFASLTFTDAYTTPVVFKFNGNIIS